VSETEATAASYGYALRDRCPCCGAPASSTAVKVASNPPAEALSPELHGRFLSGYSSDRLFFTYVKCVECGAAYCPVYYSKSQLDRLYGRLAENMSEAPIEARLKTQAWYAGLLMSQSRRSGEFLEIGADNGSFAQHCANTGSFDRFWLYEPNLEAHEAARTRLRGRSFEIRTRSFAAADLRPGSVSTGAMIHVLDHLLDPLRALQDIRDVLEPDGVLLVVTHDASSFLARTLGRRWPPYTLQHPHLFTPTALDALIKRSGLSTITIEKTVNYFPLWYLARAGCAVLGIPQQILPVKNGPLIGLRLGNIAAVARRPR